MATWRNGYAEDCKSLYPSSILGVASKINLVLILKKSKFKFLYSSVAQLVEQLTVNQLVAGSSPARGANLIIQFSFPKFSYFLKPEISFPFDFSILIKYSEKSSKK